MNLVQHYKKKILNSLMEKQDSGYGSKLGTAPIGLEKAVKVVKKIFGAEDEGPQTQYDPITPETPGLSNPVSKESLKKSDALETYAKEVPAEVRAQKRSEAIAAAKKANEERFAADYTLPAKRMITPIGDELKVTTKPTGSDLTPLTPMDTIKSLLATGKPLPMVQTPTPEQEEMEKYKLGYTDIYPAKPLGKDITSSIPTWDIATPKKQRY